MTYKFVKGIMPNAGVVSVSRDADHASIPLDPDNTDYQQFLKDWEAGAEVLNPDGTPAPYVAPETP
jgi:hypothetical protein